MHDPLDRSTPRFTGHTDVESVSRRRAKPAGQNNGVDLVYLKLAQGRDGAPGEADMRIETLVFRHPVDSREKRLGIGLLIRRQVLEQVQIGIADECAACIWSCAAACSKLGFECN